MIPPVGGGTIPPATGAILFFLMLTTFVTVLHFAASITLIVFVLLHSGKGGGLSDMFGGGMGATAAGSTVVEKNLDRLTVLASLVFLFTTMGLTLRL